MTRLLAAAFCIAAYPISLGYCAGREVRRQLQEWWARTDEIGCDW